MFVMIQQRSDIMYPTVSHRSTSDSLQSASLEKIPVSQRIVAVVDTRHDRSVSPLVIELARRDQASVVLYDLSTGSRWTTPFETGEDRQRAGDRILSAARLESLCHRTAATAVSELSRAGVWAGAFLATRPAAEELSELVWTRHIDLVVAPGTLRGKTLRNVERVRWHGAALVQRHPDNGLAVHPPFTTHAAAHETSHDSTNFFSSWFRRSPVAFR
jgi:hypothetical protein